MSGPVVTLLRADDLDHAITLANATDFGLTASVFTRDERVVRRCLNDVVAGLIKVNAPSTGSEADPDVGASTSLRPAAVVMDPSDMTGARATRHSFARALVRRAAVKGWRVEQARFDIDELGRGTAVYGVEGEGHVWSFVAFSQRLTEGERTVRVIAKSWDVTAALVEGDVDQSRLERIAAQVPLPENGRAEAGALIWTRAKSSERFFDNVVDRLAQGQQPERDKFGCSPYVMRSTAFYSDGKCGPADFERFSGEHPFAVSFRGTCCGLAAARAQL